MHIKESFISNVLLSLSDEYGYDENILRQIRGVLYFILDDYDLNAKKELPAYTNSDLNIIKHFLLAKKLSGCSDKTLRTYYTHLRLFFDSANVSISYVTSTIVFTYLTEKMKSNISMSYCNDLREVLFVFFDFCEKEGYIKENPCRRIDRVKYVRNIEDTFTDMDIVLLRNACKTPREIALVDLLISTGIRREEVCRIKLSDVDIRNRSIYIRGKGGKNRYVSFSAKCEFSLVEYMNIPKRSYEYLFCTTNKPYHSLSEDAVGDIVRKIGSRTNIKNVHTHRFRSYFATYMINKGVPMQDLKEMMGHSRLDTTNEYYVRANLERVRYQHKNNAN